MVSDWKLMKTIRQWCLSDLGTSSEVTYQQRSVAVRPKPAACIPDTTVVSLRPKDETDPTLVYFPSCTRVKRCGGCCSHQLLSCQPVEIQTLTFEVQFSQNLCNKIPFISQTLTQRFIITSQVIKSQYTGGTKMTYRGKDIMPVEEHLKCKCDCRIKEEDCSKAFQKYDKSQCKCYCTNVDDQHKCLQVSLLLFFFDNEKIQKFFFVWVTNLIVSTIYRTRLK